jgi:L,D-transpeptidase catalytic domain
VLDFIQQEIQLVLNQEIAVERLGLGITIRLRMTCRSVFCSLVLLPVVALLPGCQEFENVPQAAASAIRSVMPAWYAAGGWWENEDVPGRRKIVVHLGEQKAYFYKGRHLIGQTVVSTGKSGFGTPPGHYSVTEKDINHVSSEFGDYVDSQGNVLKSNIDVRKDERPPGGRFDGARMPYFMRLRGGYGMHAGYVPPYRASHGCIRLPERMARHFFEAAPEGTTVIVKE